MNYKTGFPTYGSVELGGSSKVLALHDVPSKKEAATKKDGCLGGKLAQNSVFFTVAVFGRISEMQFIVPGMSFSKLKAYTLFLLCSSKERRLERARNLA